jgi:hypothetical protein
MCIAAREAAGGAWVARRAASFNNPASCTSASSHLMPKNVSVVLSAPGTSSKRAVHAASDEQTQANIATSSASSAAGPVDRPIRIL